MKTPEEWSREIYDKCYSPVMGKASVKPEFVAEIQADAREDLSKALYHANLTVKTLERFLKKRGDGCSSRGITKWELNLLRSAYDALLTPLEDRKFGLNNP